MSYASEVLADSPIIYLKLDETSGTVAHDSSGNGHHFTYNAGATLGATSNLLNSVMAQGSGAAPIATLMSMPDAFTDFTIECWVTVDTTAERGAFVKIGDDHSGYAVGVGGTDYDGNGNQLIGLAEDTSWMQTGASIGTGEHHVVSYRRSSDNAWFHFLDGTQVNVVYASRILPLTRIDIGGDTASSRWLTPGVKVNHVSIYNYELGATRIAAHYAAGIATTPLPRYEVAVLADTPLIYLKLDETSGTTAVDSSGNGYDFTYGAGVSFASGTNDLGTMVSGSGSVQIASIPMPATIHDFAIECWVTLDDTSQSGPFVKIGGTGGYAVGVGSTDFNTAGNQLLSVPDGSSGILSSGTSLTAGEQHQVVLTWHVDTARWRVYLDKVLVYDANTGRSWPFDYIFIGSDWNWTSYLSSGVKINHVSIYDHELTAARVVAHYAALPSARIIANDVSSQGFVYDPASITSDDAYIGELSSAVDAFSDTPFPDFVGYPDAEIFPARPVGVLSQDALLPSSALVVTSGDFVDTQDTTGRALTSPTSANHPDSTAGSWYRYTPSTDGTVTLDTTLSILDTYIFLMADDLTTIVAEDDDSGDLHGGVEFTSWLQASVVGGTTYYICVCGYDIDPSYSTGIVTLQLAGPEPVTYVPPTNTVIRSRTSLRTAWRCSSGPMSGRTPRWTTLSSTPLTASRSCPTR